MATRDRHGARTVVVVGGSLAGLRGVEALREGGFGGRIVVVGAEHHRPYERPPLSKQVLAGERGPETTAVRVFADGGLDGLDVAWELGVAATGLDLAAHEVALADGRRLGFDGLLLACGSVPKRPPGWLELDGVHELRSLDDGVALRDALAADPARVVVVGAGFIGAEVAAVARQAGLAVMLVEPLEAPMVRGLGVRLGTLMADLHRDHGVDVRLGVGVERLVADDAGRVRAVVLGNGDEVAADVVVVGVGVRPATDWLEGSGLELDDGVVCDATCRAAPGVVAAGDVARWRHPDHAEPLRVEHWDNAVAMGQHAARTLLADLDGGAGEPYAPVPWFWSDQYDRKVQVAGRPDPDADDMEVVAGGLDERRFVALFGRDGRLTGVVGMSMPAKVARHRRLLDDGIAFAEAVAIARET